MGRRALRKVKTEHDFSYHFRRYEELRQLAGLSGPMPFVETGEDTSSAEEPDGDMEVGVEPGFVAELSSSRRTWSPATLFGRTSPLELEIGSGKGLFLRHASRQFPDHDFLGVEIAPRYAQYAGTMLARDGQRDGNGRRNAVCVAGDALILLDELVADESLAAIHVYFPDPWWKARHRKRRVVQDSLARHAQRTLIPGGILHFWTDVEEYFHSGVEAILADSQLTGPIEPSEIPADHDLDYRTHFERRTRLAGLPVYRSEFHKKAEN